MTIEITTHVDAPFPGVDPAALAAAMRREVDGIAADLGVEPAPALAADLDPLAALVGKIHGLRAELVERVRSAYRTVEAARARIARRAASTGGEAPALDAALAISHDHVDLSEALVRARAYATMLADLDQRFSLSGEAP
jgi:hypothetical protein